MERGFLPILRFVELGDDWTDDPRIDAVRSLHENDAPTAVLAIALGSCILLTDNRRHFEPLELPDRPTDAIAVDLFDLGQYFNGAQAAALLPVLTGVAVIEGSKKTIATLGRKGAAVVGAALLGATVLWWVSKSGERVRENARKVAHEVGPPLARVMSNGVALQKSVSGLAIEPRAGPVSALVLLSGRW